MIPDPIVRLFLCAAMCPAAAAAQPAPPRTAVSATAREVVDKQLAAKPVRPAGLSGAEASRIRDHYLDSIGRTLETDHIAATSGAPR